MNGKPTCEDLETRIGFLEEEINGYKKVQEELREANRLLEAVLDGVQDIIGIKNPDHTIVWQGIFVTSCNKASGNSERNPLFFKR
jgi:hypothetical protein